MVYTQNVTVRMQ